MALFVIGVMLLVGAAGFYLAATYRSAISDEFQFGLRIWRLLRLVALVLIGYGLWVSGRPSLQFITVLIALFAGAYLAIEQPFGVGS